MPSPTFVPLILGGDIGAYALGREFHEAYGVRSVCASQGPIDAITKSRIFDCAPVEHLGDEEVERVVREQAARHAGKTVLLITNLESVVGCICRLRERLPENVVTPTPSLAAVDAIARKDLFIELCRKHGVSTPQTQIVDLADPGEIAPCEIAFPVVAKPSYSADYAPFIAQGFRKVYLARGQQELDELWASLRAAGFGGTFLVQEFVPGDDTMNETVTVYVAQSGRVTLLSGARTLINDHSPSLMGNSVAMLTQDMPELYDQAEALLRGMDYRGYACMDVKRDPRDGRVFFLEMNPLYTLVPRGLLHRYLTDDDLRRRVVAAERAGLVYDPQRYTIDRGLSRMLSVSATELNQYRKFARYYPRQSETSF